MDFKHIYSDPKYLELAKQSRTLCAAQKLIQDELNKHFSVAGRFWGMQLNGTPVLLMEQFDEE